ncbi:hypothetical protein PhCBS80983_g04293 [Powellomyces hirtus]|uniref:G-protein coupled receptors family 2 profile 2 domain-containing protein n=1 Tax=Powellomyces hirtus TaxID=109895 RepID=A0A507E022_9FUNG|nr:hypothetical protein PhCBS80983_g04293 [Powellomyces hirtus]
MAGLRLWSLLTLLTTAAAQTITNNTTTTNPTCVPNPGYRGLCSRFGINYPISLSPTATIAAETALLQSPAQLAVLKVQLVSFECGALLQELICTQTYPRCASATPGGPTVELRTCKSSCNLALETCRPIFAANNILTPLPGCDTPTDLAYRRTTPYFEDTTTTAGVSCVQSEVVLASISANISCPFPFVKNPYWPDQPAPESIYCNGPCCGPCPIGDIFHAPGMFKMEIRIHQVSHFVAFIMSLFVAISYSVLPGRREHPADIVLHFAVATCIWMAVSIWTLPDVKKIQCAADGVTPSTAVNNQVCGAQAAWLLMGVHATVLWGAYMIWNLHFTIVRQSNLLARYKPVGVIICWGVPVLLTVITLMADTVDASTGPICFISSQAAVKYVFGFQGAVMVPTVVMNVWTFFHIARVARLARGSSAATSASSDPSDLKQPKPMSKRRQLLQLVSMNWRALLLGVVFVSTYVIYFIFYTILTDVTSTATPNNPWVVDFFVCLVTSPIATAQETCTAMFADYLPSPAIIIAAYATTGMVGIWIFIVFGLQKALVEDWKSLLSGQMRVGGGRWSKA